MTEIPGLGSPLAPFGLGALGAAVAITLAPHEPALAVAVYAALHTTLEGIRKVLDDRPNVRFDVTLEPPTKVARELVVLHIVNRGHRNAVIVAAGFAPARVDIAASNYVFHPWRDDRGRLYTQGPLNIELAENQPIELTASVSIVVTVGGVYARWIFIRDSRGKVLWQRMPPEYFDAVPIFEERARNLAAVRASIRGG